jgi:hypothetical protein
MRKVTKHQPRVVLVDDNRDLATSLSGLQAAAAFEAETSFDGPAAL